MESQKRIGLNDDLQDLVAFMKREKVLRIKGSNVEVELHPMAFVDMTEIQETHDEAPEFGLNKHEQIAKAKELFNEMIGGI